MPCFIFAILTGIFFGLQGTYSKILTKRISPTLLTWGIFTFTLPYLLLFLLFDGIPEITWKDFWWSTTVSLLVNVLAWNLFFRALKESDLAHTMPFTSFTPLFLIPVAYFLLGEMPDRKGILGILLIISGGYGIHLESKNLLKPFKSLLYNKGTRLMLIVSFIWSISATVEKVAVLSSSQVFYGVTIQFFLSLAYLPYLMHNKAQKTDIVKKNLPGLFLLGLISGLLILFQFTALKYLFVSYVIAFKRAGIIISVFLGIIIFKEKNPLKNILCALIIVSGVFLLL